MRDTEARLDHFGSREGTQSVEDGPFGILRLTAQSFSVTEADGWPDEVVSASHGFAAIASDLLYDWYPES